MQSFVVHTLDCNKAFIRTQPNDGRCRDMCDNMERFFYQAWKEGGLPLPPGAGPTITRVRPTGLKGQQPSVYDSDQQANRGHKRKHAEPQFEV